MKGMSLSYLSHVVSYVLRFEQGDNAPVLIKIDTYWPLYGVF